LIDPTVDEPEDYFRFFTDGTIRVRLPDLNDAQKHRANETLRVFNLCHESGPLRDIRMTYCAGYATMGQEIAELARVSDSDDEILMSFLEEELERIRGLPFETAIKHTLLSW